MLSLVFCVVIIILKVDANKTEIGNPEIRLGSFHKNNSHVVWKDKSLKIVIENNNARYVRCYDFYANSNGPIREFVPETAFNNDIYSIINVTHVTTEMSTKWKCTVYVNYFGGDNPIVPIIKNNTRYTQKDFHFHLYVKGARTVNLSANNRNLTFVTTDLSVSYDGESNYTYVDGEDLQISCEKAQDDEERQSTLRLEYYNEAGSLLFRTKPRDKKPHVFGSVLKSNNDNYYLDCIRTTHNPRRDYRYRTIFLKKEGNSNAEADQRSIMLSVDGQQLVPIPQKDKSYDDYIFRYIDPGKLNITCQKMGSVPGTLNFYENIKLINNSRAFRSPSGALISFEVSTSNLSNKTVTCGINNTEVPKPNARILFLQDELAHDIHLRGLPSNNVLYEYTNDDDQWTIEYQYSINETINVTCVVNIGFFTLTPIDIFQWKFKGIPHNSSAFNFPNSPSNRRSENPFSKILDATHNRSKLQCTYFRNVQGFYVNRTVELIFRLKPESSSEANNSESTSGKDMRLQIILISVSVGAISIITVICLVLWRKKSKRTQLIESECDNHSNQNDSPIPAFPSQWETNCDDSHYAQIDEGVMEENDVYLMDSDKSYRMPNKRQSNNSENHYTEIDDYFKPKPGGLTANWSSAHPPGTQSHNSKNSIRNHFYDSKEGMYDNLRHDNLPVIKGNEKYSNVRQAGKRKNVTFEEMRNEFTTGRDFNEGTSRQNGEKYDPRLEQNKIGQYANINQGATWSNTQPGNFPKIPHYENHILTNEKPDDLDYAEPYGDLGIRCNNDFYG